MTAVITSEPILGLPGVTPAAVAKAILAREEDLDPAFALGLETVLTEAITLLAPAPTASRVLDLLAARTSAEMEAVCGGPEAAFCAMVTYSDAWDCLERILTAENPRRIEEMEEVLTRLLRRSEQDA